MEYIHIKNIDIKSEAHLEDFVLNDWETFFDFDFVGKRIKIHPKSVIDILGKDNVCFYIVELKYRPIRKSDRKQLLRYIRHFNKIINPDFKIRGIFIGYNHLTQTIYSENT